MKLTLMVPAFVALLGLALAGSMAEVHASSTTTTTATAKVVKHPYRGTLAAINTGTNTLTVKTTATKELTLTISPLTKFKGAASLSGFAVGDKVSGSYTKDAAGTMTAYSLHKK